MSHQFQFAVFKTMVCALLVLPSFASANAEMGESYTRYPYDESVCILRAGSTIEHMPDYVLDMAICDGRAQAWLSRITRRQKSPDDLPNEWVVVDRLTLGTLKPNEHYFAPFCGVGKSSQFFQWVALYRWKKKKLNTHKNGGVVQAWVINPKTERFELASSKILNTVVCQEEDYGD